MRREIRVVLTAVLICSFFISRFVQSASMDIVVNEIGAYATSTHEWIEIWNRGNEPVDIRDWKFWENNTNHGLSASAADSAGSIVSPGEYAAIAQDAEQFLLDYPNFVGSVFDSVWASLSEDGEDIGLKDAEGNFVEKFTYASSSTHSLERRNPFLGDYTSANWQEHANGNSAGTVNSNFFTIPALTDEGGSASTTASSTIDATHGNEPSARDVSTGTIWSQIKINEIMINPASGNEWVELYNPTTSSLDLTGGVLCDNRAGATCVIAEPTSTIPAGGWLAVYLSGSRLNNDGDSVILKNPDGAIVDEIRYGNGGASVPREGRALARKIDGVDSDSDSADWALTTQPTSELTNIIVNPVVTTLSVGGSNSSPSQTQTRQTTQTISCSGQTCLSTTTTATTSTIILNELYPYPDEDDDEFIEIKNTGSNAVNLSGWKLADLSRQYFLSGSIGPGEIKIFDKLLTGIALNNSAKETVKLINPQNYIMSQISYSQAEKGQSYSLNADKRWYWTDVVSGGAENVIPTTTTASPKTEERGLVWKIKYEPKARVGEKILFDAKKTLDPRGGRITYGWNFGGKEIFAGPRAEYTFVSSGLRDITVFATSSAGTVDKKVIKAIIYPSGITYGAGVVINEILPNAENDGEYVKIKNITSSTIIISNWQLMYRDKIYNIPTSTYILPNDELTFYQSITDFTLNNAGGELELRFDNDALADAVSFGKSKLGQIYFLKDNEWRWPDVQELAVPEQKKTMAAKKATTSAKSAKKSAPYPLLGIEQARELPKDEGTKVRGIVSVLPGTFGSQYFYISDSGSGIQIYQFKKDFPKLAIGDAVEIKGIISEGTGQKRVKVKKRADIKITTKGGVVSSSLLALAEFDDETLGAMVRVRGEITEIKNNFMYVDDGETEAIVYFKRGTKIDKKKFKEGENVEITGVLEQGKNGFQIWPRSQEDLIALGPSEDLLKKQALIADDHQKDTAEKYLTATAGGITTLLLGFLARARGAVIVGAGKKLISVAGRLARRG